MCILILKVEIVFPCLFFFLFVLERCYPVSLNFFTYSFSKYLLITNKGKSEIPCTENICSEQNRQGCHENLSDLEKGKR